MRTLAAKPLPLSASSVGLDDLVDATTVRRGDPRERRPTVDHLEQRRLLAVEVLARSLEPPRCRHRRTSRRPSTSAMAARSWSTSSLKSAFVAMTIELGVHRTRGDERALDDRVRVRPDDRAILERARLALGGVDDDRGLQQRRFERLDRAPLDARREAGAAASTQSGSHELLDHRLRRDGTCGLESLATTGRDVLVDVVYGTSGITLLSIFSSDIATSLTHVPQPMHLRNFCLTPGSNVCTIEVMDDGAVSVLQERMADLCGHLNVLHAQLVDAVVEALDNDLWQQWGIQSPEHWLAWQTGLSPARAQPTGRHRPPCRELPVTFAAFADGELSVDQVVTVAKYTPSHNDAEVCQLARAASVSQLRNALSRYVHHVDTKPEPVPIGPTW